ncbi:hypothetical protein [Neptunitalea lumnitzerae]|uniref:Uncharacterized protein n=1 Tax=Neptunitalea lumnitzerae TaxID=2965509 RepID=A0ABQ5MP65_9FLAO|nr:hypothetical protein [Neptunitalea sp. Y10]GLB50900.1 hypothetical protein Y10_32680 [Neptunitalea sp. Y10]
MKLKLLNTAFIVTLSISIVIFIYLVFIGYDEIRSFKDVIKIIGAILFPIPILFFTRFFVISNFIPEHTEAYKMANKKPASIRLVTGLLITLLLLHLLEWSTGKPLESLLIVAHLINSTTISLYVFNYLLYNNLKANGVLSGILLALALHVFFLSSN